MNNRPYLDKLVTSPHIPKLDGQTGYCSRHIIPDLSCPGVRSEFEPKTIPTITADGKMTKVFVMNAHRTMRELERGIVKLNAKEEIFKLDHRQYIDKLLLDMEGSKRDKHERRMRHWKSSKDAMGFGGSFESAFGAESSTKWQSIPQDTTGRSEFSAADSRGVSPMNIDDEYPEDADFEEARVNTVANASKSATRVRIMDSNPSGDIPVRRLDSADTKDTRDTKDSRSVHSMASNRSFGSHGSQGSHGFSRPSSGAKKVRAHSRMALFNALLDTVEPPISPKKRFGSIIITKNDGIASTKSFGDMAGSTRIGSSSKK